MVPARSQPMMCLAPAFMRSLAVAMPEAPAPVKTIVTSSSFFLTTLSAFVSAASTTTAVPC